MAKIKSNARFTHTRAHVDAMVETIETWRSPYRKPALEFMERLSPDGLFVLLHSMRRWYSGQTMTRKILAYRWALRDVMAIEPRDAVGVYRGFKVLTKDKLADAEPGDQLTLPVTRNHGFSSWSTTEAPTHKFSGGGRGKVGLVVRLVSARGITPVLAPPSHTERWFNALYERVIGRSFRPKEGEYLISSPSVRVEVVRVKRR